VGCATTNECYDEEFSSIKLGCYNERGGILSADVARACASCVGLHRFDQSVSHLGYRLQVSVISLVQLSAYLYGVQRLNNFIFYFFTLSLFCIIFSCLNCCVEW
jgi:hypothetical protein